MTPGEGKTRVRPWEQFRGTGDYLLLEPGWARVVDDDELAFIQRTLQQDPAAAGGPSHLVGIPEGRLPTPGARGENN